MKTTCPKCDSDLERTRRKLLDKIINIFVPVMRFKCYRYGYGCDYSALKKVASFIYRFTLYAIPGFIKS